MNKNTPFSMSSNSFTLFKYALTLIPIGLLVACAPQRLMLPEDLTAKTQAMPVTMKKFWYFFDIQRIHFGPFLAFEFHQGWTKGDDLSINAGSAGFSSNEKKQGYSFKLKEAEGPTWKCDCQARAKRQAVEAKLLGGNLSIPLKATVTLNCSIQETEKGALWNLKLTKDATESEIFSGDLSGGNKTIKVESSDKVEGGKFNTGKTVGYIFSEGEKVIGAVETSNKSNVWLGSEVGPELRSPLAAVASALLGYQDLLEQIESEK